MKKEEIKSLISPRNTAIITGIILLFGAILIIPKPTITGGATNEIQLHYTFEKLNQGINLSKELDITGTFYFAGTINAEIINDIFYLRNYTDQEILIYASNQQGITKRTINSLPPTMPFLTGIVREQKNTINLTQYFGKNAEFYIRETKGSIIEDDLLISTDDTEKTVVVYAMTGANVEKKTITLHGTKQETIPPTEKQTPPLKPNNLDEKIGRKIKDDITFETNFLLVEKRTDDLQIIITHDAEEPQLIWIEGIDRSQFTIRPRVATPHENITVSVILDNGKIPNFKLHVGTESEVFEFGEQTFTDLPEPAKQTTQPTINQQSFTIQAAPTIAQVILNSTGNNTRQNITAYAINATDSDTDPVQNITDWRINGTSIAVLNMPFETNTSSTTIGSIADYSQHLNNGTLGNGTSAATPNWTTSGKVGGAYVYDGSNDYIDLGNKISNFNTSEFTIELWMKSSLTDWQAIIGKRDVCGHGNFWEMRTQLQGKIQIEVDQDDLGTNYKKVTLLNVVTDGNWHHIAAVRLGSTVILYLDGTQNINDTPLGTTSLNNSNTLRIGNSSCIGQDDTKYFNGTIDEVRMYSRALTADQIWKHYFDGNASKRTETIVTKELAVGQNWTAAITPNDRTSDGTTIISNNLTIVLNNAPSAQVILNSTNNNNNTGENITANILNVTDPDGDPVQNITDWRANGTSIAIINLPFESNITTTTLNAVADYSLNAHNGTLPASTATPTWNHTCKIGACYDFDGSNDYLSTTGNTGLSGDPTFSIEAWIYPKTTTPDFQIITGQAAADQTTKCINFLLRNGKLSLDFCSGGLTQSSTVSTNTWHHVVAVKTPGLYSTTTTLYVDGADVTSGASVLGGADTTPSVTDSNVYIGIFPPSLAVPFQGAIDEVRVYNRALTTDQVYALYTDGNNGLHPLKITTPELRAGTNWTIAVTPNDKTTDGPTILSNTLNITEQKNITNSAPTIAQVILNSTNGTNNTAENLTAYTINATDADGDPVQNITDWRRNSTSITLLNMPFEKNTTSTTTGAIRDYSVNGNNGTLGGGTAANTPTWNYTCKIGACYTFDGTNDYISTTSFNLFQTSFTVEAWLFPNNLAIDQEVVFTAFQENSNGKNLHLRIYSSGAVRMGYYSDDLDTASGLVTFGAWNHVLMTYNNATDTSSIYVNGNLQASGSNGPFNGTNPTVEIGRWGSQQQNFSGSIDEIRVYNFSFTPQQANQTFQDGNNSKHLTTIVSQELVAGTNWTVAVTPNDGKDDGTTVVSDTINITEQQNQTSSSGVGCATINASTTLAGNVNKSGTCFTINANHITLNCAGFSITYDPTDMSGGKAIDNTNFINTTITNCNIIANTTPSMTGDAISLTNAHGSHITNTTIKTVGANTKAISLTTTNHTVIDNVTITTNNSEAIYISGGYNNTIANSTLETNGSNPINLYGQTNPVQNNTVTQTKITTNQTAIKLQTAKNNTFNNITAHSKYEPTLTLDGNSENNFIRNSILSSNTSSAIKIDGYQNHVYDTTLTTNIHTALEYGNSPSNINISNTTLRTNNSWIISPSTGSNNNLTNTLFQDNNGSIRFLTNITIPTNQNISLKEVNISYNKTLVNVSARAYLNVSAQITLTELPFNDVNVSVDYDDDGGFAQCPTSRCTEHSYTSGTFIFNVTAFTTYAATMISNAPTIAQVILNSTRGTNTPSENITAYILNATDPNNDPVQNITDWRKNGISITVMNMPFESNMTSTTTDSVGDYSQYKNNGTLGNGESTQAPTWNSSGKVDGAYIFDGTNDYIEIQDNESITTGTNNFTLSTWFKTQSASTWNPFFERYPAGTLQWGITFRTNAGKAELFYSKDSEADYVTLSSSSTYNDNNWHHAVATKNASTWTLYVDSTQVAQQTYAATNDATGNITLGSNKYRAQARGWSISYFNGTLDEMQVYNFSFTPQQANQTFQDGNNSKHLTTIVSQELVAGTNWTVAVTPNDKTSDGTTVLSNTINITLQATRPPVTVNSSKNFTEDVNSDSDGVIIANNDITIDCQGNTIEYANSSVGIGIQAANKTNIVIKGCNINSINDENALAALILNGTNNSQVLNLEITGGEEGIIIDNAKGNSISNVTIGSNDSNAFVISRTVDTIIANSSFSSDRGTALQLINSSSNNITNTTLSSNTSWISTDGTSTKTNLSRTLFQGANTSIFIVQAKETLPTGANITAKTLNVTYNKAFLNSTAHTYLNTTSQVIIRNVQSIDAQVTYDPDDSGNYIPCSPSKCTKISYSNGILVVNVTGFSSISTTEANVTLTLSKVDNKDPANASLLFNYTITVNVTSGNATNFTVRDTYPPQIIFISSEPLADFGTNNTWSIGNLTNESSAYQINITVNVSATVANGTLINNTANVTYQNITNGTGSTQVIENTTIVNATIPINSPTVTLNSPANQTTNLQALVPFNCSATGTLTNITLYHNLNGTYVLNRTFELSSGNNSIRILHNITHSLPTNRFKDTVYTWNCEVCNTNNLCAFATNTTFSGWDLGTYQNITFNTTTNNLLLTPNETGIYPNITGLYTSKIFDAGFRAYWTNLTIDKNVTAEWGTGKDGNTTITSANQIINTYDYLTGNQTAGDTTLTVQSGKGFLDGDEILIYQTQNTSGGVAGTYEFRTIKSGGNTTSLTLDKGLTNAYKSGSFNTTNATVTQIVKVPHYDVVTINSGGSIIAQSWNGTAGGIIAFRALTSVTINSGGAVNVTGRGYRGGPSVGIQGGPEGEGYQGLNTCSMTSVEGSVTCSNPTQVANSGGGGGGAVGNGGGGGGGHRTTGFDGSTNGGNGGSGAATYSNTEMSLLTFGGGGGTGGDIGGANDCCIPGGNGGGLIIIKTATLTISGTITSNGQTPASSGTFDGGSGGGAGGTIYLSARNISATGTLSTVGGNAGPASVTTAGGKGGNGSIKIEFNTFSGTGTPRVEANATFNGTDVKFRVQGCDYSNCSDTDFRAPQTRNISLTDIYGRYFRYRYEFETSNNYVTPYFLAQSTTIIFTQDPNVNATITKAENSDPFNISLNLLNYTIEINVSIGNLTNVTVHETYPTRIVFVSSQPNPDSGTNNTWSLGNLSIGTSIRINISVDVNEVRNGTLLNNTANVTYQNSTGTTRSAQITENTTIQVEPISCPITLNISSELTQNISGTGTCIIFGQNDITLDCNGYEINYAGNTQSTAYGININGFKNSAIKNCKITQGNASTSDGTAIKITDSNDTRILYTNITVIDVSSYGILLNNSNFTTVSDVVSISTNGTALRVAGSKNNTIANSTFQSTTGVAATVVENSQDNMLRALTIRTNGTDALRLEGTQVNKIQIHDITASTNAGSSLVITNSVDSINISNITMRSNFTWFSATSIILNSNLTTTRFAGDNGSITILPQINITTNTNISQATLNISYNRAFLNSTALSAFNRSAQIVFTELTSTTPRLLTDVDDDGTYATCGSVCTLVSYTNGTLTFNVTSFTSHSSQETQLNVTILKSDNKDPVNATNLFNYTITVNVTGGNATNVTVQDQYPTELIFVSSQPNPNSGTNNTWSLGNLTNGTIRTVNITLNVSQSITDGVVVNNTANATFQNFTNSTFTNTATESTTLNLQVPVCGDVTTNTTLKQNITSTGTCFTFTINNTFLDCAGYEVKFAISSNGSGLQAFDKTNVTIRNCRFFQNDTTSSGTISQGTVGILFSRVNNSLIENTIVNMTVAQTSTETDAILISDGQNILIRNTSVRHAASEGNRQLLGEGPGRGLRLVQGSQNNTITNNTISTIRYESLVITNSNLTHIINNSIIVEKGASSESHSGILTSGTNNTNISHNNIVSNNGSGTYITSSSQTTFESSTTLGTGSTAAGIYITTSLNTTIIHSNTTSVVIGTYGIDINSSSNTTIINSTSRSIITRAKTLTTKIENTTFINELSGTSLHNTTINNTILLTRQADSTSTGLALTGNNFVENSSAETTSGSAITLTGRDDQIKNTKAQSGNGNALDNQGNYNNFTNLMLVSTGTGASGITLKTRTGSTGSNYSNITLITNATYISVAGTGTEASEIGNITQLTFQNDNVSIKILETTNIKAAASTTKLVNATEHVNLSPNKIFLNSTAFPELNKSAQITINNISWLNGQPYVDYLDNGSFSPCTQPKCRRDSYLGGVLIFNVTGFTSFSSSEGGVNITITKTDQSDPIEAGNLLNYTLEINVSFGNATNITVKEAYPSQIIFINSTPTADANTANSTWTLGNLSQGSSFRINITVNISDSVVNGTIINNTANVSYQNFTNNTLYANVTETTTISNEQPTIAITKTDSPDPVYTGGLINYTITINVTVGTAKNVTVRETYPDYTIFNTATPSADAGTNNTFSLGDLSVGTSRTVNITVNVSQKLVDNNTAITNTVNVTFMNRTNTENSQTTTQNTTVYVTPINCGTITADTDLNQDLTSSGTCFTINANNFYLNCHGHSINYSTASAGYGISLQSTSGITIQDCTIQHISTFMSTGAGINADAGGNHTIKNTTVIGGHNTDAAIIIGSSSTPNSNTLLTNISVRSNSTPGISTLGTNLTFRKIHAISNSSGAIITSTGGVSGTNNLTIEDTIAISRSGNTYASIDIQSGGNITVTNTTTHSVAMYGFSAGGSVQSVIIRRSDISSTNNSAIFTAVTRLHVEDTTLATNRYSTIDIRPAGNQTNLSNVTLRTNNTWVIIDTSSTDTNFTNTLFKSDNSSVFYSILNFTNNAGALNISQNNFNISHNKVFLNITFGSALSILNRTATIRFHNLTFSEPTPTYQHNDTENYKFCSAPRCSNVNYTGKTLTFNVTNFSSYSSRESGINLTISKTDTPDPVTPGKQLNYTITISVDGGNATNVTVNDTYPSDVIFSSSSPSAQSGTNNTWDLGNLTDGTTRTINVTVTTFKSISNGTIINNTANITYVNFTNGTLTAAVTESTTVRIQDILTCPVTINDTSSMPGNLGSNQTCITINTADVTLYCRGNTIYYNDSNGGTANAISISGAGVEAAEIRDCNIIQNNLSSSFGSADAINLQSAHRTYITNTSIQTLDARSRGISLTTSNHTVINNVSIYTNGTQAIRYNGGANNTLSNSTLNTNASNAINLEGSTTEITNNTIKDTRAISNNESAILITSGKNSTLTNITAHSREGSAIEISSGSKNQIFNSILTSNTSSALKTTGTRDEIHHTTLSTNTGIAAELGFTSSETNVSNVTLRTNGTWISTGLTTTPSNFTNTEFKEDNGSIRFLPNITTSSSLNISRVHVNITYNKAFVNVTARAMLNVSAQIQLYNLTFLRAEPTLDLLDNGTVAQCPLWRCSDTTYKANTLTFNTTGFTTYLAGEGNITLTLTKMDTPDPVDVGRYLNYTIEINVSNGTANNVTVNDTYPSDVIFINSTPNPDTGTNNTWTIGNLTNFTSFRINITVNITSGTASGIVINNTANATYQNITNNSFSIQIIESTTISSAANATFNFVMTKGTISCTLTINQDADAVDLYTCGDKANVGGNLTCDGGTITNASNCNINESNDGSFFIVNNGTNMHLNTSLTQILIGGINTTAGIRFDNILYSALSNTGCNVTNCNNCPNPDTAGCDIDQDAGTGAITDTVRGCDNFTGSGGGICQCFSIHIDNVSVIHNLKSGNKIDFTMMNTIGDPATTC